MTNPKTNGFLNCRWPFESAWGYQLENSPAWHLIDSEICTIFTHLHLNAWICTSVPRVKHGESEGHFEDAASVDARLIFLIVRRPKPLAMPVLSAEILSSQTTQLEPSPRAAEARNTWHV